MPLRLRFVFSMLSLLTFGVALSAQDAYVVNSQDNTVSVIDTLSNIVVATIPVGTRPNAIAISPDGSRAYVTNFNDNTVSVIDTSSKMVVATIAVEDQRGGFDTAPAGSARHT